MPSNISRFMTVVPAGMFSVAMCLGGCRREADVSQRVTGSPGSNEESAAEAHPPADFTRKPVPFEGSAVLPQDQSIFTGSILSIGRDRVRVQADPQSLHLAEAMTFAVTGGTKITVAAEPARKEELTKGMRVTVTAAQGRETPLAMQIDAKPDGK